MHIKFGDFADKTCQNGESGVMLEGEKWEIVRNVALS